MVGVLAAAARPAQGAFHLWTITEVYTNADGTIQFIELFTSSINQELTSGHTIESILDASNKKIFLFLTDTPAPTTGHHLLLATAGFAGLAGAVTPDFMLADGFLYDPSGTVNFVGAVGFVSYTNIPTDGVTSLNYPGGTSAPNSPTNYAGQVGDIEGNPIIPLVPGDFNGDGVVDPNDLPLFGQKWLVPPLTEVAAHWKLDESAGTTATDSSANSYHGTLLNGPIWQPTGGKVGGALQFDGIDDYVDIDDPNYKGVTGTASRTLVAWIKTSATSGSRNIVSWGSNVTGEAWVLTVLDSKLALAVNGGIIVGSTNVADDNWHHVAAVLDDDGTADVSEVQLYVDGLLETASFVAAQPINTAIGDNVKIGIFGNGGTTHFNGLIDDVRIYDRALSNNELISFILNLNLAARWKLDESVGTTAADSSSNGYHGTLFNDPTWQPTGGKSGGALQFDGIDDFVEIDDPNYKGVTGSASRTVVAWIKTSATSGSRNIVSWGSNATGQAWVLTVLNSKLTLAVIGGQIAGSTNVADDNWHHIAAVLDDDGTADVSEVQLYVDGLLETASFVAAQPINTAIGDNVKIGIFGNGGATHFNGLIDDVRIYDRAMILAHIQALPSLNIQDLNFDDEVNVLDFVLFAELILN